MRKWIPTLGVLPALVCAALAGYAAAPDGPSGGSSPDRAAVADALGQRGASASDQYRALYDDALSRQVREIHPSVNDDGTPDLLVVVAEGVAEEDAEAVDASVREFLTEHRGMDFSRGYTTAVYDTSGNVLRRLDATDCSRGDGDPLRCDPE